MDEQGVYRNCGVNSKVQKLLQIGLEKQKQCHLNLFDENEWESRTVTSAVKTYLRLNLELLLEQCSYIVHYS